MSQTRDLFRCALTFALTVAASIALAAQGIPTGSGAFQAEVLYEPSATVVASMTVDEARRHIRAYFIDDGWRDVVISQREIRLVPKKGEPPNPRRFGRMQLQVVKDGRGIGTTYALIDKPYGDGWTCGCFLAMAGRQRNVEKLSRLADAFLVLKLRSSIVWDPDFEQRFDQAVAMYTRMSAKPSVPEEVRRLGVQAQVLLKNSDFNQSADSLERALELAPWWPQGHYNLALVYEAEEDYRAAVVEMRRYLALVPDAADARDMQDKVYEWELLANGSGGDSGDTAGGARK